MEYHFEFFQVLKFYSRLFEIHRGIEIYKIFCYTIVVVETFQKCTLLRFIVVSSVVIIFK